ncbi:MAG: hypothetical protein HYY23_18185 [Verrucomicrobia bacterium]|nr:hypothetical protein [Verrucomicrobiota bacterium]
MLPISNVGFLVGALALALIWPIHASAAAEATSPTGLYAKRDTWSETLLATRQNVLRGQSEKPNPVASKELTVIWKRFSVDFPAQARWLTRDAGAGKELAWLAEKAGRPTIEPLITRALASVDGAAKDSVKQANHFRRPELAEDDPQWFDLYSSLCQYRDCLPSLHRIWILDLRRLAQSGCEQLLAEPNEADARWKAMNAKLRRINEMLGPGVAFDLSNLRTSIEHLSEVPQSWLADKGQLLRTLAEQQPRWQASLEGAAEGTEQALDQLGAVAEEIRHYRRDLLLATPGMKTFLSIPANFDLDCEWESQYETLEQDLGNRAHFARVEKETFRREALIQEADRDPVDVVLRRASALLADLEALSPSVENGRANLQVRPSSVTVSVHGEKAVEISSDPAPSPLPGGEPATDVSNLTPLLGGAGGGFRGMKHGPGPVASPSELKELAHELSALRALNSRIDLCNREARYLLFANACRVRREIAFRNPLLNFDELVFIKRHRALFNHMCDQYYGMAATPGGGLYVLAGAFGPSPQVRDVLHNSVVQSGRLAGQKLQGGSTRPPKLKFDGEGNLEGPDHEGGTFVSPELSYDGQTILFAYVENKGDKRHWHHTDPAKGHWAEGRVYHIFKVNVDGSNLQQLTDGTWNDFDPCWLPNGRIAFISERRGGYLRCGRTCPTYTLFDMEADGSDITCLSFHETNEWHPSVTHDGRIVYTRWDYVDRHGVTAHFPWITTLDGRDSRAVHGNFAPRELRPDMELDCQAVPGSHKFVATAAPHHGQAYGSLVLVDPQVADDDKMAPVKRLTPDVGFPETQNGKEAYGTAWPLSENYYLCAYDAETALDQGRARGNYGLYLVDAFGNKELIYRDPDIASQSPIPLRPRPRPPVASDLIKRSPETNPAVRANPPAEGLEPEGTVAVLNVYDSLKTWPEGTKITHLRVLQLLPMTVPSGAPPHETGLRARSASDSVVPVRHVLGTTPVEEDGSAHFVVPANKEIFFQALDVRGLAVQSMRSSTYLQKGQQLVCIGCHEPKSQTPVALTQTPLALRRPPSRLQPDVDGSNPFSYPRLVQPVLDKQCVQCHAEKSVTAPNLAREPLARHWYASYNSLVQKFGFHEYDDRYRTTPGHFGARASGLLALLEKGHYDVKLSDDEMHRLTLWLDCMSMFYGVYEKKGGEAQLRGEIVRPTLE